MGCCVTPLLNRHGPSDEGTISPKRSAKTVRFEGESHSHRTALIVATTSRSALPTLTIAPIRGNSSSPRSALGFTGISEPATAITRPRISLICYVLLVTALFPPIYPSTDPTPAP